jgi:MTH538 TIR-like domain (DUF1863)
VGECLRGSHIVSEQGPERADGYRAFISYSHRDDGIAKTLHKRLETYRLPKKLIGRPSERGPIPARLTPIFRDLDELSAADDLSVEIKAALARSEVLIILCSPGAKASKWVNLEIETFRALHGNSRPVLAALIEGEPAEAFPPALTANGQEPVAADFRKNAPGGKRLALLKLVAGITAAPLDALVQRDTQRQYRRVMAITGGALAASLVMALLLVVALRSQAEAQRQRQEAEGLVEYMLTDLRDKLKGVTTLDVMNAVNERAMIYYTNQSKLERLPAESIERRARILLAMGEDYDKRGENKLAMNSFQESYRATWKLLLREPKNPSRIFAHAQSEYWIGYLYYNDKIYSKSYKHFSNYAALANKLIIIDDQNPHWLKEAGYANGNMCMIALKYIDKGNFAVEKCRIALVYFYKIKIHEDNEIQVKLDIANRHAWLAEAFLNIKDYKNAILQRKKQFIIIDKLLIKFNHDSRVKLRWLMSQISMANFHKKFNFFDKSELDYKKGLTIIDELIKHDNDNVDYKYYKDQFVEAFI